MGEQVTRQIRIEVDEENIEQVTRQARMEVDDDDDDVDDDDDDDDDDYVSKLMVEDIKDFVSSHGHEILKPNPQPITTFNTFMPSRIQGLSLERMELEMDYYNNHNNQWSQRMVLEILYHSIRGTVSESSNNNNNNKGNTNT